MKRKNQSTYRADVELLLELTGTDPQHAAGTRRHAVITLAKANILIINGGKGALGYVVHLQADATRQLARVKVGGS